MPGAMDKAAFRVGTVDYTWGDVVDDAKERGEWTRVELHVREGLAAQRHRDETGEELTPEAVHGAGAAFRYERRLIAAEEMEAWLDGWGVKVSEWTAWIRRSLLRELHGGELDELTARFPADEADVEALSWTTAVCSGELIRFAEALATHIAVPETPVATTDAVQREIERNLLDWTRLDYDVLSFPREAMAREALLWITADQRSLDEVADATGIQVERHRHYLDQADESLRDLLIGADAGETKGPVTVDGKFELVHIRSKGVPATDDDDVLRQAEQAIVGRAIQRQLDERVRWYDSR